MLYLRFYSKLNFEMIIDMIYAVDVGYQTVVHIGGTQSRKYGSWTSSINMKQTCNDNIFK